MNKQLQEYLLAMDVAYMSNLFDGGRTFTFSRQSDGIKYRDTYYWGDEDAFERRVRQWLDKQPWPREDDPRVSMAGTYEDRRA